MKLYIKLILLLFLYILLFTKISNAYDENDLEKLLNTNICIKCDLSGADLRKRNLANANLQGSNLNKVNLWRANLENANLELLVFLL